VSKGWISVYRQVQDHWLYQERRKFSRFEAWIDMLLTVNHSPRKVVLGNQIIDCGRGQSILSLDSWAQRWKWDKSAVRRFFEMLKKDHMIETENISKTTRITICKYDIYQDKRHRNETELTRKRNDVDTELTPNNNDNNKNNINNDNKSFDQVWELYDKKVGSKSKLEKKWLKLTDSEKKAIMEYIPKYREHQPDKRYRKNFETFLNNQAWKDELPSQSISKSNIKRIGTRLTEKLSSNGYGEL